MPTSLIQVKGADGFPVAVISLMVIYVIVWLVVMVSVLDRRDMTSVNRFLWVFILVMVPVFGPLLYWFSRGSTTRYCSTDQPVEMQPKNVGSLDCPRCGSHIEAEQNTCANCHHEVRR